MSEITERELEDIEALFVQTARSLASDGDKTITLDGLSPSTLYFADRPQREVGHMPTKLFVDLWGDGENSFAIDPPNAVLSFADPDDRPPHDVVVTIRDPQTGRRFPQLPGRCARGEYAVLDRSMRLVHRPVRPSSLAGVGGRDGSARPPSRTTSLAHTIAAAAHPSVDRQAQPQRIPLGPLESRGPHIIILPFLGTLIYLIARPAAVN